MKNHCAEMILCETDEMRWFLCVPNLLRSRSVGEVDLGVRFWVSECLVVQRGCGEKIRKGM